MLPFIKCFLDKIFGDGTSFENLDVNTISKELQGVDMKVMEMKLCTMVFCHKKQ